MVRAQKHKLRVASCGLRVRNILTFQSTIDNPKGFQVSDGRGYTLIELIVVLVLVGMTLTLAAPRLRHALLTDDLKSTARKMVGIIVNLRNEAIREQRSYALHFDMNANRSWTDHRSMTDEERAIAREKATRLPADVHVRDVWIKGVGKIVEGDALIRFTRKGYTQKSAIHLRSEDGREFTLVLNPFSAKVKILEKYVEFD